MSQALPGTHLCKEHQGNHSYYDPENCELCQARAEIERLRGLLSRAYGYTTNAGDLLPEEIKTALVEKERNDG